MTATIHHIEEIATVYLRLSDDGKAWEIDSPSDDGCPLFGYDDGALHEECECRDEEGNLEHVDTYNVPELPTLPELHRMIGEYLA